MSQLDTELPVDCLAWYDHLQRLTRAIFPLCYAVRTATFDSSLICNRVRRQTPETFDDLGGTLNEIIKQSNATPAPL